MVAVRIDLRTADSTATGVVDWTPTKRRHIDEDPDHIVLPVAFSVALVDGVATVDVDATGIDWCWRVIERVAGGAQRYVIVPDVATVDYGDLVDVDPETLSPTAEPEAAWWAALDDVVAGVISPEDIATAVQDYLTANPPSGGLTEAEVEGIVAAYLIANPPEGGSGVSDHGALTGLSDDDHTQYALADGSRGSFASTAQGALAATAVQPGDLPDAPTWTTISGKPVVVAEGATQAAARAAIGAGTSSLTIGTTSGTAKAGDYEPDLSGYVDTNDARLSDARTPTAHAHAQSDVTGLSTALAGKVDGVGIGTIEAITQAAYDLLPTPRDSTVFYVIVG